MHNAVTLALVLPSNKTATEAPGTVGWAGRRILPVKHICFREQVFRRDFEKSGEAESDQAH